MSNDQHPQLANFDVSPLDRDVQQLREALVTMRAFAMSPTPLYGWRRFLATRLHLPMKASQREWLLRREVQTFMENYETLLNMLDPSSQTEHGDHP